MEIHIIDWIIYFVGFWILSEILDDDNWGGCVILLLYTLVYVAIVSVTSWIDIIITIKENVTISL
jgi:hypothetical protein